ncbi:mpv17-like protein isoform X1 [Diabrotica virgifera virgifera]|uniref:Mpv17-like protein n=2 Tax=Diabrotica virgifera virgifera TaxID=50390 RepID=A0ABM5KXF7_DIAVI|nr:mpv17-like protein isoform X1 [Diabrotica virgifera virgifera]
MSKSWHSDNRRGSTRNMNSIRLFIKTSLVKRPIITNSIIYGTLCTFSEFSQQTLSKKLSQPIEPYDTNTIIKYVIYGTGIGGPLIATWYRFLDKKIVGTTLKISAKKLLIDQFTFTAGLLVVFYTSMSIMEGKKDIFEECRQKFIPTFKTSCCFWLPAQLVNFMVVPAVYRVTYIGVCSFVWINILCMLKREQLEKSE